MTDLPMLDDSELAAAALHLARPHCPECFHPLLAPHCDACAEEGAVQDCPYCGAELDPEYFEVCLETARKLYRVAALARRSAVQSDHGFPVISVLVQAPYGVQMCRECGCTDLEACPGGCSWAAENLCSACAQRLRHLVAADVVWCDCCDNSTTLGPDGRCPGCEELLVEQSAASAE